MKISWGIFVMASLMAGIAQAEPYKWVDKEGKVHYSDQKPESSEVQPDTEVEKPDLDKGNFISAEEAGLIVTEEEKQRRAEVAAKKKAEEERLEKEQMEVRKAAEEAEAKAKAEAEKQEDNHHDDDGYDYYEANGDRPRPGQLPAERPRPPINRPTPRKSP